MATRKTTTKRTTTRTSGGGAPGSQVGVGAARGAGNEVQIHPPGVEEGPVVRVRDEAARGLADQLATWWRNNTDRILGR